MRTTNLLVAAVSIAGIAGTAGGCKWTDFDDLADETWVNATEKPNVKSSDYGVAIQRGNKTGSEGRLVVIGAGQATFSELIYDAKGDSTLPATALELNGFGIGNLELQPIVLADPAGDSIALVINAGGSSLLVLEGAQGGLNQHPVAVTPSTVDAATYMLAPGATQNQVLIGSGEVVLGTFYGTVPNPQPKCKLTDAGTAILPRALGVVRNGASDDVIAWGSNGKLYRYVGGPAFNGCGAGQEFDPAHPPVVTGFMPGAGSQILALNGNRILLQGHQNTGGFLQVYDAVTLAAVGGSITLPGLRTAAILDVGTTQYVIAGYPTNSVDGKTAGEVLLFRISATGIESSQVATLNDAQPENNQAFGRAVAAMPYHGAQVIAVAADNEIFVYFRANLADGSQLYGETRQGR